jgi:hypothetical protein
MIISDKQIMQLMGMCRSYAKLCAENHMSDEHEKCKMLHREIEKQQSEKLFEVRDE